MTGSDSHMSGVLAGVRPVCKQACKDQPGQMQQGAFSSRVRQEENEGGKIWHKCH